ncbi:MAG TPA: nitronate monooxygenase [Bacteroidia bacterium]|nr:nitronate monooxygenase [Bacteroidia bacterium]
MKNRVCELLKIELPIIQAGMIWCSGWHLAAAVSNAGGLGIIGAGSMYPPILQEHIRKCKEATNKPFGVNVPLLYPDIEELMTIIVNEGVQIVFTSAGNPAIWTGMLKEKGITVVHVVSNTKFAKKAVAAGADALVAEGFEAGGHNGREETTTLCLVPLVCDAVDVPVIAAGGIGSGRAMAAAFALGAEAVQIGSRFVLSEESSAHINFKTRVMNANEGDTVLTLKQLTPVRMIKNAFYDQIQQAEARCADAAELKSILGRARAKKGMFEGDLETGELEIGQVSAQNAKIMAAAEIVAEIWDEFNLVRKKLADLRHD